MTDYWWEPPLAGTEIEHLLGAIDRQRATFRWKADGLDAAQLTVTVGASTLTLGGLLKHLALVEDYHSTWKLGGTSPGDRWRPALDGDGWDFRSAADDSPRELYALWDSAVAAARERYTAALADGGLDRPVHLTGPAGEPVTLRRLLFDLLEEYARHTGHADLLREAVDGRTGEDPPAGWKPQG
ncbi:DinB family protein [Actinoplanes sp. L3-i22]|uniref:DinB family protein n=1 Tax=Actinoplanes sp. L3-i22 TaxID=2836373 RepID=UPI001C7466FB|nr:DinB family protein [Actinoplanes sp. L3-i22]BCY12971.1 mini-circle protein [Actinoplanes sp. L3-i22]